MKSVGWEAYRHGYQHHTLGIHSFHPVGIIGSIIGALVLLLLLRLMHLEPGRRRY